MHNGNEQYPRRKRDASFLTSHGVYWCIFRRPHFVNPFKDFVPVERRFTYIK
jgi:hypothetical protein